MVDPDIIQSDEDNLLGLWRLCSGEMNQSHAEINSVCIKTYQTKPNRLVPYRMLLVLFVPVITKTDLLLGAPSSCPVFGRFRLPGPRTPERLQAPAPLSRSHSVSPKRTSLNRKDREKTDTGNIGISARSCDARRSEADPFSLRIAKRLARNEV